MAGNRQELDLAKTQIADGSFLSLDGAALGAFFVLRLLSEILKTALEEAAKIYLFPIMLIANSIRAILAIREAYLEKGKNGSIARAVVEVMAASAVSVALIGGLVASSIFAAVTPIIFVTTLAFKSVFNAGAAIYYGVKSLHTEDQTEKTKYRTLAKNHAIVSVATGLTSIVVGLVVVAGKAALTAFGIVSGIIFTGLGIRKGVQAYREYKNHKNGYQSISNEDHEESVEPASKPKLQRSLSSSALIAKVVGFRSATNDSGTNPVVEASKSAPLPALVLPAETNSAQASRSFRM